MLGARASPPATRCQARNCSGLTDIRAARSQDSVDAVEQRETCSPLVLEMPYAREDHRQVMLIRCGDDFRIAHGAAGLNDRGDSVLRRFVKTVTKWEESI